MKSFIVLALTCFVSASALAKPIQPANEPASDTAFFGTGSAAHTGMDYSATGSDGGLLEDWALAPTNESVQILSSDGGELTYRRRAGYDKYCQSSQRNAWGFGGRCFERNDESTSVPEPGTLALLGVGLFLLGITQRRRRRI